jgi:hypothetical protein
MTRTKLGHTPEYTPPAKYFAEERKAANGLDVATKVILRAVLWTVKAALIAACLATGAAARPQLQK